MNIENILSFIYVYRFNSFHKAANALYVTQPTLSSRIRTLERDLHTRLIHRSRSRIDLTEDGQRFLPYALQILSAYTQAQNILQRGGEPVIIGANVSVSVAILPHVLRGFRQRNPDVSVEIFSGVPGELVDALLTGRCSFILTQEVSQLQHPDITAFPVYQDPVCMVVPPGHHFLSRTAPVTFREAAMEPMVRNTLLVESWDALTEHFASQGVSPNIVLTVDSLEATKHMVLQGVGITFMPELSIEMELLNRQLVAIHPEPRLNLYRDIVLAHRADAPPPRLDQFVDLISRYESEI